MSSVGPPSFTTATFDSGDLPTTSPQLHTGNLQLSEVAIAVYRRAKSDVLAVHFSTQVGRRAQGGAVRDLAGV